MEPDQEFCYWAALETLSVSLLKHIGNKSAADIVVNKSRRVIGIDSKFQPVHVMLTFDLSPDNDVISLMLSVICVCEGESIHRIWYFCNLLF